MKNNKGKLTIAQKILLSLYKHKSLTSGHVSMMKGLSYSNAYNTLMLMRRLGFIDRQTAGRIGKFKFTITCAGIEKLRNDGILPESKALLERE